MSDNGRSVNRAISENTLLIKQEGLIEQRRGRPSCTLTSILVCVLALFAINSLLTILGAVSLYLTHGGVRQQVLQKMSLQNGTLLYEQWLAPDVQIYKDFYIFNWTNPSELSNGVRPNLTQVGPYRYREYRNKTVVNVSADGCQVTYTQHKIFIFDRESTHSDFSEDDVIQTLNLPVAGAVHVARESVFLRTALDALIPGTNSSLHKVLTVRQLIWGYEDEFIKELKKLYVFPKNKNFSIQINDNPRDQNPSIVRTGVCESRELGQFVQWDGMRSVGIWGDRYADMINGTEGFFFHPFLTSGDRVTFYVDDAMRSIDLVYQHSHTEHSGMDTFRFGLSKEFLLNASTYPPNARWYQYCPEGLFYVGNSSVMPDVPAYASKPHFLDADASLLANVSGLSPDSSRHELFVDIEPTTGTTVAVHNRVQINYRLERAEIIYFSKIPPLLYLPILYSDETVILSQDLFSQLAASLDLINLLYSLCLSLLCVSTLCLSFSFISCLCLLARLGSVVKKRPIYVLTPPLNT